MILFGVFFLRCCSNLSIRFGKNPVSNSMAHQINQPSTKAKKELQNPNYNYVIKIIKNLKLKEILTI